MENKTKDRFQVCYTNIEITRKHCLIDFKKQNWVCLAESDNEEELINIAKTLNKLQPTEL